MQQIIISIIIGLIVIGGGAYVYQNKMSSHTEPIETSTEMITVATTSTTNQPSFLEMLQSGEQYECTFSVTDTGNGVPATGTTYISGQQYRVTADTTIDMNPITINVISQGPTMYMWTSNNTAMPAMKIDLTDISATTTTSHTPDTPVDWLQNPNTNATYDCQKWTADPAMFVPPIDIEFIDMKDMMSGLQNGVMNAEMMNQLQARYGN